MKNKLISCAAICAALTASSHAANIISTGFAGVVEDTSSGVVASGFTWDSDFGEGGNASTSLTFVGDGYTISSFIAEQPGAAGTEVGEPIGIAGNVGNQGDWSTSFTFTAGDTYDLSNFAISSYSITAGGAHQNADDKPVFWLLSIKDGSTEIFSGREDFIEPAGTGNLPGSFNFDLSGFSLNAGTQYTFDLTVGSDNGGGNNIALNSLALEGVAQAVPEPSSAVLLGIGGAALILRRKK
ncbi:PEP-CTERM sorting domain-containing protein [Sulfuriroseicoccus oceanibius]|uniref:PEP-CTERM sorting domain-containing protein n=1 Tax=Sulfuriroseicoccus oceanibius TaxID=2707525 RepID=A0A6B3L560_9BACT|nr:PEP-CTERM sorting domain-containing protein [Sulfuriroseicoccus oceanibius]QQL45866.1 PEP-CTERM sorting domain-containing protein [Sulfuriroseicoccus oceanibius]